VLVNATYVGDILASRGKGDFGAIATHDASPIVPDVGRFHDRDGDVGQVSAVGLGARLLLFGLLCTAGSSPRCGSRHQDLDSPLASKDPVIRMGTANNS
jgi:hypothetical protein